MTATNGLSDDAGTVLLPLARAAICTRLRVPAPEVPTVPGWAREPGASFVTLTQQGRLRGCIGSLEAHRPLADDVTSNAQSAAFRDPRFQPLGADEVERTHIEVSVLSAPEPMQVADEQDALAQLRPHVDGLILEARGRRGTFLPQVWEQLPDPHDFLEHLRRKAGLPGGFWDESVRLSRYTVSPFEEDA